MEYHVITCLHIINAQIGMSQSLEVVKFSSILFQIIRMFRF